MGSWGVYIGHNVGHAIWDLTWNIMVFVHPRSEMIHMWMWFTWNIADILCLVVWNMNFIFPYIDDIGNGKTSQLTFTPSFFRGVGWNHQAVLVDPVSFVSINRDDSPKDDSGSSYQATNGWRSWPKIVDSSSKHELFKIPCLIVYEIGICLVVWNNNGLFFYILGIIIPTDEHFFREVETTNQELY